MSNVLKVAMQHAIVTLLDRGRSQQPIARELGLARETVAGYARRWREGGGGNANQTIPTTGSGSLKASHMSAQRASLGSHVFPLPLAEGELHSRSDLCGSTHGLHVARLQRAAGGGDAILSQRCSLG
ncbi:MAG: helix-turn-helix domain-containing protein [Victivallales bacterium]|nr:helix-turn-helix domain-containing protein [Victivallales bacterium]